jgi:diguanylate cyclase (GGDEF)-like protein
MTQNRGFGTARRRAHAEIRAWLPTGRTLPYASWQTRHRAVVVLLLGHAAVLGFAAAMVGRPAVDVFTDVAVPALGAFAASRDALPRAIRSCIGAVSLMLTSGVVVHLMSGSIEAHFHFFAMIPIVALYEDWLPFILAVGVVLIHHGVMGTLDPKAVYDHQNAWRHPWQWAFIHAGFFAAACVGSIVNWRLHEKARQVEIDLAQQMRHHAHHDELTGLPNRTSLLDYALSLIAGGGEHEARRVSVLMIDLDRFKEVNDVLGHASGDQLLAKIGPLMATAMRSDDLLARLGGDEFAAVLVDADEHAATNVARRLTTLLTDTVEIDGVELAVEGSIGIASDDVCNAEDIAVLMQKADIAMYAAKRSRSGHAVYSSEQETASLERLTLLSELRRAIDFGQIVLHYQPKVSVESGTLVGVEALARWQHPARGLLAPGEFIAAAESTGLIVSLTLNVLDQALGQVARWWAAGNEFPVAVNLSPRSLAEPELTENVLSLLVRHELPPHALELEITEDTLVYDPERALTTITALHEAGIRLSIDDFGTGYSSMSRLRALPVSELKVDRGFVMGMLANPGDEVLVRSVVELGHNLGLSVVAEGVEDQATLEALARAGCDAVQGYHLARPMAAEAMTAWLCRPVVNTARS